MQKAADRFPRQGTLGYDQLVQEWVQGRIGGQIVCFPDAIEGRPHDGMPPERFHPLSVDKNDGVHAFEGLFISRCIHHNLVSRLKIDVFVKNDPRRLRRPILERKFLFTSLEVRKWSF
jgi:hypothetical protein